MNKSRRLFLGVLGLLGMGGSIPVVASSMPKQKLRPRHITTNIVIGHGEPRTDSFIAHCNVFRNQSEMDASFAYCDEHGYRGTINIVARSHAMAPHWLTERSVSDWAQHWFNDPKSPGFFP